MNANAILLGLALLSVAAVAPTAAADVTLCHYNWHEGCVGGERTVETELVDCYVYYYIPIVDCDPCPLNDPCL